MRKTIGVEFLCTPLLIAMLFLAAQSGWTQVNRATVTGTVTDISGAIMPGAEVTATKVGTGVSTKTLSNQAGIYVLPNLFPGKYSLEFKRDGFETLKYTEITL